MRKPEWLTYHHEFEIRVLLHTSKLESIKRMKAIAQELNISGYGLRECKDYVETLTSINSKEQYPMSSCLMNSLSQIELLERNLEKEKEILGNVIDEFFSENKNKERLKTDRDFLISTIQTIQNAEKLKLKNKLK